MTSATAPGTLPVRSGNGNGELAKTNTVKNLFEAARSRIVDVAPKHLSPDRLMRVALMTISRTPKLAECTPHSLLNAFMTASQLGLEVGGVLGEAYLVPYKTEATFILGYRGMINLARRSGQIISIEAQVVREGDIFDFEYGLEMRFKHQPKAEVDAPITHAWALARFRDGGHQLDVMTIRDIEAIRKRSRSGTNGPWVTDFAEMAKKTVVRRLCKYLPLSPEMADAVDASDRNEFGDVVEGSIGNRAGDAKRPFGRPVIDQHPTDETRTLDTSTSNLSETDAEDIINRAPRAPQSDDDDQRQEDPDVSGGDAEPQKPDLASESIFIEAAKAIAKRDGVPDDVRDQAFKTLRVSEGIGGGRQRDTQRRNFLRDAMEAGAFDWKAGKLAD
jgi:recombination protein RecT